MRKEQLNQLVSNYKRATLDKELHFSQIYKVVQPMVSYVKKRFNRNFLALVDYESVASEALLKSIDKYVEGSGHFANYFMTWLRSMVTREGIKNSAGLRLPDHLAKKDFQISEEAKQLMISGRAKEDLMDIYKLTPSQYESLLHYYTEVPKYLERDTSSYLYDDSDIAIDIRSMLDMMPEDYSRATVMMFGLQGSTVYSDKFIEDSTGLKREELLEYLYNNPSIKQIMGEYR